MLHGVSKFISLSYVFYGLCLCAVMLHVFHSRQCPLHRDTNAIVDTEHSLSRLSFTPNYGACQVQTVATTPHM